METDLSSQLYAQNSEPSIQSQVIHSEMTLVESCRRVIDCNQNL